MKDGEFSWTPYMLPELVVSQLLHSGEDTTLMCLQLNRIESITQWPLRIQLHRNVSTVRFCLCDWTGQMTQSMACEVGMDQLMRRSSEMTEEPQVWCAHDVEVEWVLGTSDGKDDDMRGIYGGGLFPLVPLSGATSTISSDAMSTASSVLEHSSLNFSPESSPVLKGSKSDAAPEMTMMVMSAEGESSIQPSESTVALVAGEKFWLTFRRSRRNGPLFEHCRVVASDCLGFPVVSSKIVDVVGKGFYEVDEDNLDGPRPDGEEDGVEETLTVQLKAHLSGVAYLLFVPQSDEHACLPMFWKPSEGNWHTVRVRTRPYVKPPRKRNRSQKKQQRRDDDDDEDDGDGHGGGDSSAEGEDGDDSDTGEDGRRGNRRQGAPPPRKTRRTSSSSSTKTRKAAGTADDAGVVSLRTLHTILAQLGLRGLLRRVCSAAMVSFSDLLEDDQGGRPLHALARRFPGILLELYGRQPEAERSVLRQHWHEPDEHGFNMLMYLIMYDEFEDDWAQRERAEVVEAVLNMATKEQLELVVPRRGTILTVAASRASLSMVAGICKRLRSRDLNLLPHLSDPSLAWSDPVMEAVRHGRLKMAVRLSIAFQLCTPSCSDIVLEDAYCRMFAGLEATPPEGLTPSTLSMMLQRRGTANSMNHFVTLGRLDSSTNCPRFCQDHMQVGSALPTREELRNLVANAVSSDSENPPQISLVSSGMSSSTSSSVASNATMSSASSSSVATMSSASSPSVASDNTDHVPSQPDSETKLDELQSERLEDETRVQDARMEEDR